MFDVEGEPDRAECALAELTDKLQRDVGTKNSLLGELELIGWDGLAMKRRRLPVV